MIEKLRIEAVSVISTRTRTLFLEILERLSEPVLEVRLRTPREHFGCARRRDYRTHLLARLCGSIFGMGREIGDPGQRRIQFIDGSLDSGADVQSESRRI